ncbi:LPS export ABC transporter permease LptG [Geoalkalibacter halelectricus]|uniref:LPS export ABC transporter permease LptG n=1 Tax=Geoalkalibacter halelectricus TaxID=2847045 RepID=A0ABY5ZL85_9BACT|nr:LPS export ABC transporter permease LptG [Geoalkalibacter halelectricus]MDO3379395.1 LPS export ABC transporter permease LptG [Geoalkalibacter halelectricus]UWZ78727.1 LPS export ABC transporter permease LptG [Geoalkalibacter halelectricus]
MKLIDRYILRRFFHVFGLSLAAFVGLYLLVDFFEKVDNLLEQGAPLGLYLAYFSAKVPLITVQVAPMAVLMGAFMAIGGLSRTSELTALWAGGISLPRIAGPLLGTAGFISLLLLLLGELVVPWSIRTTNEIWETRVHGRPTLVYKLDRLWLRDGEQIINVRLVQPEDNLLQGVSLFRFDEDFRLVERIEAPHAEHIGESWQAAELQHFRFAPGSGQLLSADRLREMPLPLTRAPEDFRGAQVAAEELNFRQLRQRATVLRGEGYDPRRFIVDMHNRLATPFATLIMAFIGIPFALQKGRNSRIALGIAITVAIGFSYHMLHAVSMAMGYAGILPPLVSAWSVNLLFVLLGTYLLLAERAN